MAQAGNGRLSQKQDHRKNNADAHRHQADALFFAQAHLIQYYHAFAPYLLPHIQGRSLSLHMKLKGPRAPGSYIKDKEGREPECAMIGSIIRRVDVTFIDYLVCNNTPTLLYTINLGCIDVNPWTSSIHTPLNPDYIIIDLDPSVKDFTKVIAAARAAKTVFDKHRLKAFPKTSGKTGIHLYLFLQVLDGRIAAANAQEINRRRKPFPASHLRCSEIAMTC